MSSSAANSVEAPSPSVLEATKTLFRPADSPELRELFGRLAIYEKSDSRFELSASPSGEVNTRAILAKGKELRANSQQLEGINLEGTTLFERLVGKLPQLGEPRTATANHILHFISNAGAHFVSLRFGEGGDSLENERTDIWTALDEMAASGPLDWTRYEPDLKLARMGTEPTSAPRRLMKPVLEDIQAYLPFSVTLEPLADPNR